MADIDITIHGLDFANLGLDIAILDRELGQVLIEPCPCPLRDVLVDPMPVVRVMKYHFDDIGSCYWLNSDEILIQEISYYQKGCGQQTVPRMRACAESS